MSGSLSNAAENEALDLVLSGTLYVGLFTDAAGVTADQPATEATTTNCPGYARQAVTHAAAASGVKATNSAVSFTATGAWATVNYVGVFSALTGGTLKYWASITAETLANTNKLDIASGAMSVSMD